MNSGRVAQQQHIELTPLKEGQDLHLNLAATAEADTGSGGGAGSGGFRLTNDGGPLGSQLEFVCQIVGSVPPAKVEWSATGGAVGGLFRQPSEDELGGSGEPDKPRQAHPAGDHWQETGELIRQWSSNGTPAEQSLNKQWSSIRVRNIGIENHQTVIRCSAFNEKFLARAAPDDNGHQPVNTLSTSIRLNITHVPMLTLELDQQSHQHLSRTGRLQESELPGEGTRSRNVSFSQQREPLSGAEKSDHLYGHEQEASITVRPILFGHNSSFVCNVSFANPPILEPIEWLLSETRLEPAESSTAAAFKWANHVRIVEKLQTSNRHHLVERLIVQFIDRSQSGVSNQQQQQLKCRARNALGASESNVVRFVLGQQPHCLAEPIEAGSQSPMPPFKKNTGDNHSSNNNDSADKDPNTVHCPVISDKGSSSFHWVVEEEEETAKPVGETTVLAKQVPLLVSVTSQPLISLSKLLNLPINKENQRKANDADNNNNNDLKITCYASDKFGSNEKSPCSISKVEAKGEFHYLLQVCLFFCQFLEAAIKGIQSRYRLNRAGH